MDITFSFSAPALLPNRRRLKAFFEEMFLAEGTPASTLSIVFCSDAYLLEINRTYLQHDDYTDIITFDLSDPDRHEVSGEIYISVERVRANAKAFGVSFQVELHRVIFHGILHLCGYGDKSSSAKATMRQKEDHYLEAYNLL